MLLGIPVARGVLFAHRLVIVCGAARAYADAGCGEKDNTRQQHEEVVHRLVSGKSSLVNFTSSLARCSFKSSGRSSPTMRHCQLMRRSWALNWSALEFFGGRET